MSSSTGQHPNSSKGPQKSKKIYEAKLICQKRLFGKCTSTTWWHLEGVTSAVLELLETPCTTSRSSSLYLSMERKSARFGAKRARACALHSTAGAAAAVKAPECTDDFFLEVFSTLVSLR